MSGERDSFEYPVIARILCRPVFIMWAKLSKRGSLALLKQRINNAVYLKYCHFCSKGSRNPALLGNEYDIRRWRKPRCHKAVRGM
jgi:hypothetical protein